MVLGEMRFAQLTCLINSIGVKVFMTQATAAKFWFPLDAVVAAIRFILAHNNGLSFSLLFSYSLESAYVYFSHSIECI